MDLRAREPPRDERTVGLLHQLPDMRIAPRRFCLFHLALHRAFCEVVLFGCKPRSGTPLLSRLDGFAGPRCLIAQFVGVQAGKRLGQLRESYRVLTEMRKGRRLGGSR